MHSFRLRLILALIAGVTLLSVASTYFEVLEHKHVLRQELEWRSSWMGTSLQPADGAGALRRAIPAGLPAAGSQTRRTRPGPSELVFTIPRAT